MLEMAADALEASLRNEVVPQRLGRYRVQSILGRGGFGRVLLAHDEALQRQVAIKVPRRQLVQNAEDAECYLAEARAVAQLDHPHIVPVFDFGATDEFPCYIVSKYVAGETLATRIREKTFSASEAARLVATLADALRYAHSRELVHRDVKPGNIMLDGLGQPHLVDFGVALEQDLGQGPPLRRHAGLHEPRTGPWRRASRGRPQ